MEKNETLNLTTMISTIVNAYVSNHVIEKEQLPRLIQLIHRALLSVSSNTFFNLADHINPAVSIEESIQPEYIVCLEDGRKLKLLKRHLKRAYNMTPQQY